MFETLRLYTLVPTSKFAYSPVPLSLTISSRTVVIAPKLMLAPSYAALRTNPRYWGDDSLDWQPSRFVGSSSDSLGTSDIASLDAVKCITPRAGTYLAWSGGGRD